MKIYLVFHVHYDYYSWSDYKFTCFSEEAARIAIEIEQNSHRFLGGKPLKVLMDDSDPEKHAKWLSDRRMCDGREYQHWEIIEDEVMV